MDEILDDVKKLSIHELRAKLVEFGEKVGPIVPTTKLLFQKKLARKLYELNSPNTQHPSSIDRSHSEDGSSQSSENNLTPRPSSPPPQVCSEKLKIKEDDPASAIENENSVFFGVSLPQGTDNSEGKELVFTDKEQALKAVKKFSGARFKVFKTKTEAERFSLQHAEEICPSPWKQNGPKSENGAIATLGTGVSVESSPFKGPKAQELTKLRKTIEEGDVTAVESTIWDNPRYIISGGDTPVILQEGPRYNALHVAARSNQASICQLILDTLEDPSFMDKLYGHTMETDSTRTNRINFVIDLYLNTPDKGNCESPLHFACKFGFPEVVAVLVSHPKTDKFLRNRYDETPKDVICSRASNPSEAMKTEIKELLEGQYFIPLIRSEDNTTQPVIGTPWSPEYNRGGNVGTPPTSWSPKDPLMAVKACAGPMTPAKAQLFHKRWTTPPSGSPDYIKRKFVMTKREDSEKGLERIGRELAREMNVPWVEYWDFLQTYADLTTEDGLDLLEEYLQKQSLALCIEEALGKLQLLSNSNHSFMYNQMNVSQQNGSISSMASSWLMSPLEGIVESRHEGISEIEEITNEDLLERLQGDRPTLANGGIQRAASDVMRKSVRMDESFSTPVRNIYDYGRINRSMEWSMESSDWSQESFTGVLTPISCLSALFSKLSLIDRSQRQKRLSGVGPGCFTLSCMGQGYPGVVKSTVLDREKMKRMGESAQQDNKEKNDNEKNYIRDAKLIIGDKNQNDITSNLECCDEKNVGNQLVDKSDMEDANCNVKFSLSDKEQTEKSCTNWRDNSKFSNASSLSETEGKEEVGFKDVDLVVPTDDKIDEHESISDLISHFDKNVSIVPKENVDSKCKTNGPQIESTNRSTPERKSEPPKKSLFGKEKSAINSYKTTDSESTPVKANCADLKIQLELDKDKVQTTAYQSMFEILNERKNLENQRIGEKRRVIYSRDIILNLAGVDLDSSHEILVTVVIVPPNSTVAEMAVYPRIPFFVIRSKDYVTGDAAINKLPTMMDINFSFGKDSITSALAVNNRSRGKIFFINGYQPCKTDLDVHRAMLEVEADKELYPLVHRWKTLVSSRVANPSCCWPSPARLHRHGNLSASFPQVSTPRQTSAESPVVFYRSPIARTPTRQKMSSTWSMPNIRSQLFPPRSPLRDAYP